VVLIPDDNKRDLEEIPANVLADLEIHPVKRIDDVLNFALQNPAYGALPVAAK
jgi:ATP-dependent Lon protease